MVNNFEKRLEPVNRIKKIAFFGDFIVKTHARYFAVLKNKHLYGFINTPFFKSITLSGSKASDCVQAPR
jgi:hypothetical protein